MESFHAEVSSSAAPHLHSQRGKFTVFLAGGAADLQECLQLRYRIFAGEMGARIAATGVDTDRFDEHCQHLAVRDTRSGAIVATTRLLTSRGAARAGLYYSETEFDLAPVLGLGANLLEVGRTCIHPDYRNGAALAMLWQGIAQMVSMHKVDYLIGCASIPLDHGDSYVNSVMQVLRDRHFAPPQLNVKPRLPLRLEAGPSAHHVVLPPLLKGYLRQGAVICGEPYWDAAFNVADVFVLLDCDRIAQRYVKHFMRA